jgi:hypothetical protein
MSYESERSKAGRKPLHVVEIDLDFCENVYGSSPCTAAIGVTGEQKCFNTFSTCQDTANFAAISSDDFWNGINVNWEDWDTNWGDEQELKPKYRFTTENGRAITSFKAIPSIRSLSVTPARIDSIGLGQRAEVVITFTDHPYHDRGIDPYVNEATGTSGRPTSPADQRGTFWGKFRARQKFMKGRPLSVYTGYLTDSPDLSTDFQQRLYFIDKFEGPDRNGNVRIVAKDILTFVSNEKAQAPLPSTGVLASSITDTDTSLVLDTGSGAAYPSGGGVVRVGSELIRYTSISTDTLNGLTRGVGGTVADDHDADDTVQLCLEYNNEQVNDVVYDLLTTYGGVDASYIPTTDWDDEYTNFLQNYDLTTIISEPMGVTTLLSEITEQCGVNIFWHEIDQEIKFKAVIAAQASQGGVTQIDDTNNVLLESVSITQNERDRVSRLYFYYGKADLTDDNAGAENYSFLNVSIDTESEGVNQYGESQTVKLFSRWFDGSNTAQVAEVSSRYLARFAQTPRRVKLRLDAKDSDLWTGDLFDLTSHNIQNADGTQASIRFICQEVKEVENGTIYEYQGLEFGLGVSEQGRYGLVGSNTLNDFASESDENKDTYAFISDDTGKMSDGTNGYLII